VAEIPTVLRSELYAVAALAGASAVVMGNALHLPSTPVTLVGAVLCFGLRVIAIRRGWQLPVAQPRPSEERTVHGHAQADGEDERGRRR
jgi:uncharacterized membrane protein YeiH